MRSKNARIVDVTTGYRRFIAIPPLLLPIGPPLVERLPRALLLLLLFLRSVVSTSGIAKGERRDRRTAVIIKQKTTVDSDNKEEIRAPMRPRGSERIPFAGEGIETESREREGSIFAKERATGAKDVVPRTAIDLIRALPDSFSVRRNRRAPLPLFPRVPTRRPSSALPSAGPRSFPRGFLI